jgi:hypothetical protein
MTPSATMAVNPQNNDCAALAPTGADRKVAAG